jgi:hypothetical protein
MSVIELPPGTRIRMGVRVYHQPQCDRSFPKSGNWIAMMACRGRFVLAVRKKEILLIHAFKPAPGYKQSFKPGLCRPVLSANLRPAPRLP